MIARGIRRALAAMAVAALALSTTAGCAVRTEPTEIKLYYKAGGGDDRVFQECVAPGTSGPREWDNDVFTLPVDARTWNRLPTPGADDNTPLVVGSAPVTDPKTGVTRSGPQVKIWYTTDFYVNTDCGFDYGAKAAKLSDQKGSETSPVVQFWQKVGRSALLSNSSGDFDAEAWKTMLQTRLVPVQEKVLQQQAKLYDADTLKDNIGGVYERMEAALGPAFQLKLREKMQGDYFCGAEFNGGRQVTWQEPMLDKDGKPVMDPVTMLPKTVETPGTCPPVRIDITNIDLNSDDAQAAADSVYTAEQDAKAAGVRANSDKNVADIAKDPGVMRIKEMENQRAIAEACAKGANCTLIQGVGGGVNVTAGK